MRTLKQWGTSFLPFYILLVWPPDYGDRAMLVSKATHHKSSFTCCSELLFSVPVQQRKRRLKTAVKHNYILLERKHTYEERASIHTPTSAASLSQGPRRGKGCGGITPPPPAQSLEKVIILRNTHFQIEGIFDGIRIFDWRTSPRNLWLVRSILYHKVSPRETFSSARWCSLRTNNEVFFIKVLKSPRSYDFLKQIELVDIVDNMKKFQELHHQSMISMNEIFSRSASFCW